MHTIDKRNLMTPNRINIMYLSQTWIRIANKMEALEKSPRDFGTGDLLNRSETDTIRMIGMHEKINITGLAEYLGVSKSAISQMINKLSKKNLVEKYRDPENNKEIFLGLTPRGRIAYLGHEQFHAKFDELMMQNIGPVGDENLENLKRFFEAVEMTVDAFLQKKEES